MKMLVKKYLEPIYYYLFCRRAFVSLHRALFLISLKGLGLNITAGDPTVCEQKLVKRLVRTFKGGAILFDVGANNGNYSYFLHQLWPQAVIHAFEPNPDVFQRLAARFFGGEVVCVNCALSDHLASVSFYDRDDHSVSGGVFGSLDREVVEASNENVAIREFNNIEMVTLDSYCASASVTRINFLKIDVEGFELDVLRGAKGLLSLAAIDVIQFEFNYTHHVRRITLADFRRLLSGYTLFRVLADGYLLEVPEDPKFSELFTFQNIVAVRNEVCLS